MTEDNLIPELEDAPDIRELVEAADMQYDSNLLFHLRVYLVLFRNQITLLCLILITVAIVYSHEWSPLVVAAVMVVPLLWFGWWLIRINFYVVVVSFLAENPKVRWRPCGSHTMMWIEGSFSESSGYHVFGCPHCKTGVHGCTILMLRCKPKGVRYVPAFSDPIFATRIKYRRKLQVTVSCPITHKKVMTEICIHQNSYNFVAETKVVSVDSNPKQ